jgi:hypothetical protein
MLKHYSAMLAALILFAVCAGSVFGEGEKGQLGIGLSATESSATLSAVYWLSGHLQVEPAFAFSRISQSGNSLSRLTPGIGLLYHWKYGSGIRPYFGLRGAMEILSANDSNYTDIIFGPALGSEYFFDEHFSVAGELGLVFRMTDEKMSSSLLLSDATYIDTRGTLMVHLYF